MSTEGPRAARPEELPQVLDLVNRVFRSGREPTMGPEFPTLFCPENAANLRVIAADGKIISHIGLVQREVCMQGCRIKVASMGSVCTDPEHRGKGHATKLLYDAFRKAESDGCDLVLISGSRGLYRRNGCVPVYDFEVWRVRPKSAGKVEVREATGDDIPAMSRLYASEPVRFARPLDDWRKFVGAFSAKGQRAFLFVKGGEPLAYGVLVGLEEETARLVEGAGSKAVLLEGLAAVAEGEGLSGVDVLVGRWEQDLRAVVPDFADKLGEGETIGHTARILNLPRLLDKLRPWLSERVGSEVASKLAAWQGEELLELELEGERLGLPVGEMTSLIFGGPERPDVGLQGPLEGFLEAALPVPLPNPGLNYV